MFKIVKLYVQKVKTESRDAEAASAEAVSSATTERSRGHVVASRGRLVHPVVGLGAPLGDQLLRWTQELLCGTGHVTKAWVCTVWNRACLYRLSLKHLKSIGTSEASRVPGSS